MIGQRAAAANERSANGRRRHIAERFALSSGMKVARRSTVSHSKQRGNVVAGYAYRPAARIVWAVSRPLASARLLPGRSLPPVHARDVSCVVPDSEGKTFAQDAQLKSIAACRTIAQRLNLEEDIHHTASELCILRFEPRK